MPPEYFSLWWILNLDVQTGSDQILKTQSEPNHILKTGSDKFFKTQSGTDHISKIGSDRISNLDPSITPGPDPQP